MAIPPSKVIGCDFSGTVVTPNTANRSPVGAAWRPFKEGDRIAGVTHGSKDSHTGAFAEYLIADAGACFHVPDDVGLEEACTFGVGWISAVQALPQRLFKEVDGGDVATNGKNGEKLGEKDALLIYSAATNTGMHAIQYARLYYPKIFIIATASSEHHARLTDLGAHACFDYKSSTIEQDVKSLGKNVTKALDCFSEGTSTVSCAKLMGDGEGGPKGSLIRTLPPGMAKGTVPVGVKVDGWILSYTALGKPFWFLFKYYPAAPADYEIASKNLQQLTELLESGKAKAVRHRLVEGGLETGIAKGFEDLKAGRVRGEKLVVEVGGER